MLFGEITDQRVEDAVAGQRPAVEGLMAAVAGQVPLMVAARLSTSPARLADVDDIAQSVMMGLTQALPQLANRTAPAFKALLSTIVSRRVADHLRSGSARGEAGRAISLDTMVQFDSTVAPLVGLAPATGTSPSSAAGRSEQFERLLGAMRSLKQEHRDSIALAFFDQLTTAQIAERMGLTRPAASMLVIRAVAALRREVAITLSGTTQ